MDAFAVAVGFAGISPDYSWRRLTLYEYNAISEAYRESWEKARIPALAFGIEYPLPWDAENKPEPKYNKHERTNIAISVTEILNKKLK